MKKIEEIWVQCNAESHTGFICDLKQGHEGNHQAGGGGDDDRGIIWSNKEKAPGYYWVKLKTVSKVIDWHIIYFDGKSAWSNNESINNFFSHWGDMTNLISHWGDMISQPLLEDGFWWAAWADEPWTVVRVEGNKVFRIGIFPWAAVDDKNWTFGEKIERKSKSKWKMNKKKKI